MGAKLYYNRLLLEALKNPVTYTFDDVPQRYQKQVKKLADADLKAGVLPQWQYNKMFNIVDEQGEEA